MKHKIILAAILILLGNQIFSQDSIKGRIMNYEGNNPMPPGINVAPIMEPFPAAYIVDRNDNKWGWPSWRNGVISDRDGGFEIKVEGDKKNIEISFIGFYYIEIINIPKSDKIIDLKEIKLVRDHFTDNLVIGGPSLPFSESQAEEDKKLRIDVLEKYRINILGKIVKPHFEVNLKPCYDKKFIVFDFDKNENE